MMRYNLWKQLRKRIRRRRPLWTLGVMLPAALAAVLAASPASPAHAEKQAVYGPAEQGSAAALDALAKRKGDIDVKLHRIHLCGEEVRALGRYSPKEAAELLRSHPAWTARLSEGGVLSAEEKVDDWPAGCRGSAYFGLDKKGNLSLFDGPPEQEKVLRTFFQMDVRFMESSLPRDRIDALGRGIPVTDIDELNSVLSSFSDFAVQSSRHVMTPAD